MKKKIVATVKAAVSVAAFAGGAMILSGLGGAAFAQKPAEQTAPAAQAPQAASAPQRVETTVHESWTVTCRDTAEKKNLCTAILRVADNQSGNVILVWAVGQDNEGKLTSVIQTPTGIQLNPGVVLKIGKAAGRKLAYASCSARQCDAASPMDGAFLREVVGAEEATATITLIDGRTAEFKFPLKGSTQALKRVTG